MTFVFDQPVAKRPRTYRKSSLTCVDPKQARLNFLDVLQVHRNRLLQRSEQRLELQYQLSALDPSEGMSIHQRNARKRQQLGLQQRLHNLHEMSLKDFDRKILPLLQMYYDQSAAGVLDHDKLITMFKLEFLLPENMPTMHPMELDMCPTCNLEYLHSSEDAILLCSGCGQSKTFIDASVSTIAYGDELEWSSFSYKRINHLNEWLNHFQAKETMPVPDSVMMRIMKCLYEKRLVDPQAVTFVQVKKAQKDLGLRKYYDQTMQIWCRITGNKPVRLDPVCEEKIRLMFIHIQAPFDKHCPPTRKNFLSYPYVIYKFCQMLGYDNLLPYFSLLKGKEKLKLQEDIFRKICMEIGWKFVEIPVE